MISASALLFRARNRTALWLLRRRFVQMFVGDRLLAGATVLCALVSLAPLFVTTFLPLVDMGSNVGAAALLDDAASGHGVIAERFRVNWMPVPYWTGYAFMSLASLVVGPFVAAKAAVAIGVLLVPLSIMRLLQALGRSPRLGLWAFLLGWDTNIYWGWVTFQIGMPAAIWTLACLIETDSWRGAAKLIPWSVFVALTHVHAVALLGITAVAQALVRPRPGRTLGQAALALSGFAILLPWMVAKFFTGAGGAALDFDHPTLTERLTQFHRFTLDNLTSKGGAELTALAFMLFVVGPAALATLRPIATPKRSGGLALAFVLSTAAFYLVLPFALSGPVDHWWTYPRFGSYLLLGLLLLPAPDLRGVRALALAPGLILVAAVSMARVQQFAAYDDRTRPYLSIIRDIDRNASFLPLDFEISWEGTRESSLGQLHGYAAAARSAYDPHLFDNPSTPLVFRKGAQLPQPDWRRPKDSFSFDAHGRYYDYIIVHPLKLDPLGAFRGNGVDWVRDAGEWRLYRVRR
jgi:hypothetical protein